MDDAKAFGTGATGMSVIGAPIARSTVKRAGYFAEGDEVYGCAGDYPGETRLITNLGKKAWTRNSLVI